MTVDAIDGVHGRTATTQTSAEVWAAKLAEKLEAMRSAAPPPSASANVHTSAVYSPVVFAQAASFQVYTAAGSVATLANGHGVNPSSSHTMKDHLDDVHAVDSVEGGTVSTLA
jgi:hypothetical protein